MTEQSGHFAVLAVCTANICRSPLAEFLLREALDGASGDDLPRFVVRSAGIRGWTGSEMDPSAAAELRRLGGDPEGFRGRDLTAKECDDADLILTATAEHRAYILQETPQALRRTFTLLEFAHLVTEVESLQNSYGAPTRLVRQASDARGAATLEHYDVEDPFGQAQEVHGRVADAIHDAVTSIARALADRG